ncbi:MAG: FMN-binding protein [Oscillospiraceae bacterium]|nr:FMN-binding protein [Oscillospiraceae bacterium]
MKRILAALLVITCAVCLTACNSSKLIPNGTYHVEYDTCDATGYKDFVEVTFENGTIIDVKMDAIRGSDGTLKSESEEYREDMEKFSNTYPEKYYMDLINQYILTGSSKGVDVVAGATATSNSILKLLKALEDSFKSGCTDTMIIVPRNS